VSHRGVEHLVARTRWRRVAATVAASGSQLLVIAPARCAEGIGAACASGRHVDAGADVILVDPATQRISAPSRRQSMFLATIGLFDQAATPSGISLFIDSITPHRDLSDEGLLERHGRGEASGIERDVIPSTATRRVGGFDACTTSARHPGIRGGRRPSTLVQDRCAPPKSYPAVP
jgi:hypothetical protein